MIVKEIQAKFVSFNLHSHSCRSVNKFAIAIVVYSLFASFIK